MNYSQSYISVNSSIKSPLRDLTQLEFIFIGHNIQQEIGDNSSKSLHKFTGDFDQVQELIDSIIDQYLPLPDSIIIDVPLNLSSLHSFVAFLKTRPKFMSIPLIYNSKILSSDGLNLLKLTDLVDEIMDVYGSGDKLYKKVAFLKKVKNYPPTPYIKRMDNIEKATEFMKSGQLIKRVLDIVVSLIVLIVSIPVFILISIAIKIDSKGPIFFKSLRAGKNYKIFNFYKFRTMVLHADAMTDEIFHLNQYSTSDKGISFLKVENDPRVTRVGKFLRKVSLDEIPQMLNVLLGDMSLVGNRPLPLKEAESLVTNDYVERFLAPAGITGLWQISKKSKPNMTAEERVDLDIVYARKSNFFNDLKIILKTPSALFQNVDN
jgi:lipopolysaccharide/colanic/teichoic acid biosynthesis glycosyltransferase